MSVEILQARENLMKSIQTFLNKFNRISFRETSKVLLLAWEKFYEIQHAQPEDIHELLCKLLEEMQIINEELAEYINSSSWNCLTFYDDDGDEYSIQYREYLKNSSNAITPALPNEEPDNSLSMVDEHLSTNPETKSDEVIKSSVENLVPIPSESEVKASPRDSELVSLEESLSLFHIPVDDSDSFFEKFDTSLSYSDNSLPEFKTFIDHTEETSSGSTSTHADNSLPEYDSFLFKIEPDKGELTSVVMEDILEEPHVHLPNVLPTHCTLMLDSNFIPLDDSLGSDLEVSFLFGTRNKVFDPGIFFEVQPKRLYHWIHFLSHLSVIFFAH
uniref:Uncharacterized protein n=1 Tax=Tanacetum cinerariifolium TaxID=118510 RepID=A0A699HXN5_TANCI|nr:hypothetical protein [Tanacetum cinerariifolium]